MKASEYIDYLITGECSKLAIADVGDMSANPSPAPSAPVSYTHLTLPTILRV